MVSCACIHSIPEAEGQKAEGSSGFGSSLLPSNVPEAELDGTRHSAHSGSCSLQSYFPGALPASHLHLYLPAKVQTLNGVLQLSYRLEIWIFWHKDCPVSPNTPVIPLLVPVLNTGGIWRYMNEGQISVMTSAWFCFVLLLQLLSNFDICPYYNFLCECALF